MRQKAEPITVEAKVTSVDLDEVLEKAHRLQEILVEANSLVDELASKEIKLHIELCDVPDIQTPQRKPNL